MWLSSFIIHSDTSQKANGNNNNKIVIAGATTGVILMISITVVLIAIFITLKRNGEYNIVQDKYSTKIMDLT